MAGVLVGDERMSGAKDGSGCPAHLVLAKPTAPINLRALAKWVGFEIIPNPADPSKIDKINVPANLVDTFKAIPRWLTIFLVSIIIFFLDLLGWILDVITRLAGCAGAAWLGYWLRKCLTGFFNRWFGIDAKFIDRVHDQIINSGCLTEIFSAYEANFCYLARTIDYPTWTCHVKAHGYAEVEYAPVCWAQRTRPGPQQIINLYRRDYIKSEEYIERMRQAGFLDADDMFRYHQSTEEWPHLPDVLRMIVRDVGDTEVVEKYGYDEDLDEKLSDQVKVYLRATGVPMEVVRDYWRAHWRVPSFTQAADIMYRCRPGRPDLPRDLVTTEEDILQLIKTDDMAPYWAKRLMYVAYQPVTMSDGWKGFRSRAIDDGEMLTIMQDNGRNLDTALVLLKIFKQVRHLYEINQAGGMTTRKIARLYRTNKVSRDEARKRIVDLNLPDEVASLVLDGARAEALDESRGRKVMLTRRKFLRWVITEAEARATVTAAGLDAEQAERLIAEWSWDRGHAERKLTAANLCALYRKGLIPIARYVTELRRLGFGEEAITGHAFLCEDRRLEDVAKEVKKELAAREKAKKEWEKKRLAACKGKLNACGEPPPDPGPQPDGGGIKPLPETDVCPEGFHPEPSLPAGASPDECKPLGNGAVCCQDEPTK